MIPFMTEEIYQNLVRSIDKTAPESIHLCDFPAVNEAHIDKELEANMDEVLKVVVMGRACQKYRKHQEPSADRTDVCKGTGEACRSSIRRSSQDELNVKNVEFTDDVRAFTSYSFKPQLKTVGPKYGKHAGRDPSELWQSWTEMQAMDELK